MGNYFKYFLTAWKTIICASTKSRGRGPFNTSVLSEKFKAIPQNLFTSRYILANHFPAASVETVRWMLVCPNYWIITVISLCRWSYRPSNIVPLIAFASPVPIWTAAFIACCGPLSSSHPPPNYMQWGLLMRSVEQCITTEPRWRCESVMGHSDTTLSLELMTTTASNLGHSRRTIIHCLLHEK